jgi:hypothetical protein
VMGLYIFHRLESSCWMIGRRKHGVERLQNVWFRDFDIVFVFSNTTIQFLSSMPASHVAFVLDGHVVSISHQHSLQIMPVRDYCTRVFRKHTHARMCVFHLAKGRSLVSAKAMVKVRERLFAKRIVYCHKYWYRGIELNPLLMGCPRPPPKDMTSTDLYYCTELTIECLKTAGIFVPGRAAQLLPGEFMLQLPQFCRYGVEYASPILFRL